VSIRAGEDRLRRSHYMGDSVQTTLPSKRIVGSILHGAYGDYYEQALCLKHFRKNHPDTEIRLFAASESRLRELSVLDFSFAESFTHWTTLVDQEIDDFLQFQLGDEELERDVLRQLPERMQALIRRGGKRRPWSYLRSIVPLGKGDQLGLNEAGRARLIEVMRENGICEETFQSPTVGFLWRHRRPGRAVKPWFQAPAPVLVRKYSAVLRSLVEGFGCRVIVGGMKIETTEENRARTDNKYPEFGLDLPEDSAVYLKGLSWPLELEIMSRCNVCLVNASGFSEALFLRDPEKTILADPPFHYKLKILGHRMPLFEQTTPRGFHHIWLKKHSERWLLSRLSRALARAR
jgi:hypothetical protein